jgi:RimJ/RimL family protein N-acetyltransferase
MAPAARPAIRAAESPEIPVRQAGEGDVPALIGLVNALACEAKLLFVMPIDPETGAESLVAFLQSNAASGNQTVLVAESQGALTGLTTATGGVHPAKRGTVEVGIGVLDSHRGRGIGRALMVALEAWARGAGIHRLQLPVVTSNAPAIALYRKVGFEVEGVLRESVQVEGRSLDQFMMAKLLS